MREEKTSVGIVWVSYSLMKHFECKSGRKITYLHLNVYDGLDDLEPNAKYYLD